MLGNPLIRLVRIVLLTNLLPPNPDIVLGTEPCFCNHVHLAYVKKSHGRIHSQPDEPSHELRRDDMLYTLLFRTHLRYLGILRGIRRISICTHTQFRLPPPTSPSIRVRLCICSESGVAWSVCVAFGSDASCLRFTQCSSDFFSRAVFTTQWARTGATRSSPPATRGAA